MIERLDHDDIANPSQRVTNRRQKRKRAVDARLLLHYRVIDPFCLVASFILNQAAQVRGRFA